MPQAEDEIPSEGVFFEFTPVGVSAKVCAIDAATGTEVSVIGPARASQADLQRLALQKLKARLKAGR
ncbi:MAG TPA: serine hydroxymethyltransferase [Xanthobacteraceae bacterium]